MPLLKKVIIDRFGDEVAFTASSDGNVGSFEVTAAQTGTTPWPPPPVKYPKKYESAVGKLVYSKYNSQFQAEPCRTDEQRSKVADEIEAMLDADNGAGDCV